MKQLTKGRNSVRRHKNMTLRQMGAWVLMHKKRSMRRKYWVESKRCRYPQYRMVFQFAFFKTPYVEFQDWLGH